MDEIIDAKVVDSRLASEDEEHQVNFGDVGVAAKKPFNKRIVLLIGICAAIIVVCWLLVTVYGMAIQHGADMYKAAQKDTIELVADKSDTCEHDWIDELETVHHDAVTHIVSHPAEYKTVTNYHTICNICEAIIDSKTAEHTIDTGHSSWTTDVPVLENELVSEAYDETIIDQDAYDETVIKQQRCKKCGEVQTIN